MSNREQAISWLELLPEDHPIWSKLRSLREGGGRSTAMSLPPNLDLPLFVYGALKPGMPAYEQLADCVEGVSKDGVGGRLWVRDGLPLLHLNGYDWTGGFLLRWKIGREREGYERVCKFEPRSHYEWSEVDLKKSECRANVLIIRHERRGNAEHHDDNTWNLQNDAAFGVGLDTVEKVLKEVDGMSRDNEFDTDLEGFFRSQMAYLLLWSILERLSAFCFGPSEDPMRRIKRLHELPGMEDLVEKHVTRSDTVSDSRDPVVLYKLDSSNAKKSFQYYYQVRSNLSHRGKGVFRDFRKVHESLRELLAITRDFLKGLPSVGE